MEPVWGILFGLEEGTPTISLRRQEEVIGRSIISESEVLISSRHFKIIKRDISGENTYVLIDTSSNGTFLNDMDKRLPKNEEIIITSFDVIFLLRLANLKTGEQHLRSFVFVDRQTYMETKEIFKEYIIGRLLGIGCFGKVFVATTKQDKTSFALKVMKKTSDKLKEKSKQEYDLMRTVSHPNIVEVKSLHMYTDFIFLVMELITDGCLFDYVYRHVLEVDEIRTIITDVLKALLFLHDNKIVHRDVKMENVLLVFSDNPIDPSKKKITSKLTDFGLGRFVGDDFKASTLCGTHNYIPPEIYKGAVVKQKMTKQIEQLNLEECKKKKVTDAMDKKIRYDAGEADVWSCGVMLYEMTLRKNPFESMVSKDEKSESSESKSKHDNRAVSFILKGEFCKDDQYTKVDEELRDLIEHMLVVNPEERFTVAQCLEHSFIQGRKHPMDSTKL
ncbi:Calcium/calmodulin-dependent protein kinase, putative [Entamoeba invadens IP1]|uniref:Calcium/calmodulin-dependent protein kinase, putative n=1 Tax=Entamoeba invadens IP1 TaxID=370355 RepID=UPI0002C3D4F0|nr:Calcium/calmodulin-dependent protein kinase, putative [Entamoeba invadens IP1]ELP90683.1 Calcium/calmodulin-dependent protein kinase, putative [Entamoeba invadens IP1]|eukprot:XP_004257454.1 Calcium/calmodulin-dependent protein kinase, putative [Entamoeba invadens IP1]